MICHWCKGTGGECGCGNGYCDHCNQGEITDPPYGPIRDLTVEDNVLSDEDFDKIDWIPVFYLDRIRYISDTICKILKASFILSNEEVELFQKYWDDQYRDETIGDVMQRIAMFVRDKIEVEKYA